MDYRILISITGYRSADILIGKIICNPDKKETKDMLERISCFGWVAIAELYDSVIFITMGPTYKHPITNLLAEIISSYNLEFEFFSVKSKNFRFVNYSDLYDFQSKRWLLK